MEKTNQSPSAALMKLNTTMLAPFAVPYYSEGDNNRPEFIENNNDSSVNSYLDHYKMNLKNEVTENRTRAEILIHFWDDYRTFFGREYDRIICTNAFRRLQYKTQVMVNSASDDQRTRLLHSLEVQRIAKKIALGIGANSELAENIAIAHDIGHSPFGHSGERAINKFLKNEFRCIDSHSDVYFSHSVQSVKVLDKITTHAFLKKYGISGLGLSDYVLEGVFKHDSDVFSDGIIDNLEHQYEGIERLRGIVGVDYTTDDDSPKVLIGSVESQIVAWADKIAYLGHDWEELLDTKLVEKSMSRINDTVRDIYDICEKHKNCTDNKEIEHLSNIKECLKKIEEEYLLENKTDVEKKTDEERWKGTVCDAVKEIVDEIEKIVKEGKDDDNIRTKYNFTIPEYIAFKDYLAMVLSWVTITNTYPKAYAMKYDPIYVFYNYLTSIRTTVITAEITNRLIKDTNRNIEWYNTQIGDGTANREDYLKRCNDVWKIVHEECIKNSKKNKTKNKDRLIKDNVRNCFLVRFLKGEIDIDKERELIEIQENGYYPFDDVYGCLLNITKCVIFNQYIGSTRVNFMTQKAEKIVDKLMKYYYEHPEMLAYSQRRKYKKELKKGEGNNSNMELLYFISDYVAGMTDRMAKKKYDEIVKSDTKWTNEYSDGLT